MRTALILALTSASIANAQVPAKWPDFAKQVDTYVMSDSIVGAAALYMKDGKVLAHHEVGYGDRARGERVDTNSIFHWGSITKTLTAIAVMQQVEAGKLSLDAKVTSFIPELRRVYAGPGASMDDITVRMLLSHASGLQAGTWPWTRGEPWEPFEPTEWSQLVAMMPYQKLAFRPDEKYSYSNPGYVYLARIVEQLSGDPWEAYVQKNIFTPLGLTRSYFNGTPRHLTRYRSNNYDLVKDSTGRVFVRENGRDFNPGITIPNGGWNAPLGDLARYAAFLTNAPMAVGTRGEPAPVGDDATRRLYETILPRATLETMWKGRHPTSSDSTGEWMALGFFVDPTAKVVGHTGSQAGFRSFIYWNPVTRAVVIFCVNTSNAVDNRSSAQGFRQLIASAKQLLQ